MKDNCMQHELGKDGYIKIPNFFSLSTIERLRIALDSCILKYASIHESLGYTKPTQGGAHHLLIDGDVFLDILNDFAKLSIIADALEGKFIVNSFGGFNNVKDADLYVCNIHRDIRLFLPGRPLMLNLLVMLDDFTLDNGATHVLSGSHKEEFKPEADAFFGTGTRIIGEAGDILIFDSRLWHAAGKNTTDKPRRALTITFTNPFFKQQFNYCLNFSSEQIKSMSDAQKQLLGYFSRTPSSLAEWYAPLVSRMYRADQD